MGSFLQTTEWLEFQKEAGHKVWNFDNGKIRANIIKLGLPLGKSILYIPHGPEINFAALSGERASLAHPDGREEISAIGGPASGWKGGIKNELAGFIKYLKDLARQEKAIFVKIEPLSDVVMELLHVKGMRRSSRQIQPYKSVVLDLEFTEEELLAKMHQKTRYNIKVAEKHGIITELTVRKPSDGRMTTSHDVDMFWKLLQKTTKRDRFSPHPKAYYKKLLEFLGEKGEIKTDLVMALNGQKPIAGAIILRCGDTAYYLHGASDYEFRSMMAPYKLHWGIIQYLKNNGIKHYDFWGIDAVRWPGVTRFKLGWGGNTKEYPGSFDLVISKLWYLAYTVARKVL